MRLKLSDTAKKAFLLGGMCSISYLAVYIARNTLGAVSPQMIESGSFTTENIGSLSSLYFISYAIGQLINGAIGDKIKAKYMISLGLILAGISHFMFTIFSGSLITAYLAYAMTGFFLSMIYAPMTKSVAENTTPLFATRCCLGFTFASFLGSPIAGILATIFAWQSVFNTSSTLLILMGILCFLTFIIFENKGIVKYNQYQKPKGNAGGIKILIKNRIIKFTFISIITGVIRTTVVFWMPTYLSQHLGFSSEKSAIIFTISSFIISFSTFVAVFIYEFLGHNMDLTILLSFAVSAICFMIVFIFNQPILNAAFMMLAILASNCAASMLWSKYCPGLRDTGMVSSATGFLDFISYMSASLSSIIFANAVSSIGWGKLILIWFALMLFGVFLELPYDKIFKRKITT